MCSYALLHDNRLTSGPIDLRFANRQRSGCHKHEIRRLRPGANAAGRVPVLQPVYDSIPFPTLLVGVLVFPIHSLVAQSGLEFPVDEMFDCELQRRPVLKDRRSWWGCSGLFRSAVVQGLADSRSRSQ